MSVVEQSKSSENGTAIAIRHTAQSLAVIEEVVKECELVTAPAGQAGNLTRMFTLAAAMRKLHDMITPEMMVDIMALQGSSLGYKTDKDISGGYAVEVVKKCVIDGMLRGALTVNNEINIIASTAYLTKNYFTRKLKEHPGFTDLKLMPGEITRVGDKSALVCYRARWKLNGKPDKIDRGVTKIGDGVVLDERIPVRVNAGMMDDAILGKAERKIKAAIYGQITGSDFTAPDGEVDDAPIDIPRIPRTPTKSLQDLTERQSASNGPKSSDGSQHAEGSHAETGASETFADYERKLASAKTIVDVAKLRSRAKFPGQAELETKFGGLCDARTKAIREEKNRAPNGGEQPDVAANHPPENQDAEPASDGVSEPFKIKILERLGECHLSQDVGVIENEYKDSDQHTDAEKEFVKRSCEAKKQEIRNGRSKR